MPNIVPTPGNPDGMLSIEAYEDEHYTVPDSSPVEVFLKFLMEQHGLTQSELPEVGSQGVVSEILRGGRQLNARQIQALSQRFHISPAVFFPKPDSMSSVG